MTDSDDTPEEADGDAAPSSQRIDKWLWCARLFKTRSLAAKAVSDGGMRVTRASETTRIAKPSALVRPGDRLILMLGERLRILEVTGCGARRGPASEAQLLYTDHSPPAPAKKDDARNSQARERGAGRPTKRDRRAVDRFTR